MTARNRPAGHRTDKIDLDTVRAAVVRLLIWLKRIAKLLDWINRKEGVAARFAASASYDIDGPCSKQQGARFHSGYPGVRSDSVASAVTTY